MSQSARRTALAGTTKRLLDRMVEETKGMTEQEFFDYVSTYVSVGIAFMRGGMGEQWTREYIGSAFDAVSNGVDTYEPLNGRPFVVPRESRGN